MPPEQNLWRWLRRETRHLIDLHMCRIENAVSVGYPDVEGCYNGRSFHLELKAAERPKRSTTKIVIKFQRGQPLWLQKRWRVGGACWVLLRIGSGVKRQHYLIPGGRVGQLKNKMAERIIRSLSVIHPNDPAARIIQAAVARFPDD